MLLRLNLRTRKYRLIGPSFSITALISGSWERYTMEGVSTSSGTCSSWNLIQMFAGRRIPNSLPTRRDDGRILSLDQPDQLPNKAVSGLYQIMPCAGGNDLYESGWDVLSVHFASHLLAWLWSWRQDYYFGRSSHIMARAGLLTITTSCVLLPKRIEDYGLTILCSAGCIDWVPAATGPGRCWDWLSRHSFGTHDLLFHKARWVALKGGLGAIVWRIIQHDSLLQVYNTHHIIYFYTGGHRSGFHQ